MRFLRKAIGLPFLIVALVCMTVFFISAYIAFGIADGSKGTKEIDKILEAFREAAK